MKKSICGSPMPAVLFGLQACSGSSASASSQAAPVEPALAPAAPLPRQRTGLAPAHPTLDAIKPGKLA